MFISVTLLPNNNRVSENSADGPGAWVKASEHGEREK